MELDQKNIACFIISPPEANCQLLLNKFLPEGPSTSPNPTITWTHNNDDFKITIKHIPLNKLNHHFEELAQNFVIYSFVYSVDSRIQFYAIKGAIEDMKTHGCFKDWQKAAVVGNSTKNGKRQVSKEEGAALGKQIGIFMEMSQDDKINVDDFYTAVLNSDTIQEIQTPKQTIINKTVEKNVIKPTSSQPFSMASPPQIQLVQQQKDFNYLFNCIIVGAQGTGKTAFNLQLSNETFPETYIPTIGVDFRIKYVKFGTKINKVAIWETSGQPRFETITTSYFRGAKLFIIMYDLIDLESFHKVKHYFELIQKFAQKDEIIVAMVANKLDKEEERKVPKEDGQKMAEDMGALFFEINCVDRMQVTNCFLKIVEYFISKDKYQ